jgi:hypothetical protein
MHLSHIAYAPPVNIQSTGAPFRSPSNTRMPARKISQGVKRHRGRRVGTVAAAPVPHRLAASRNDRNRLSPARSPLRAGLFSSYVHLCTVFFT